MLNILFIGNSYTYFHNVDLKLEGFARAAGIPVQVERITKGGYSFAHYLNPENEYGAKVAAALSSGKKYDFVVLQEQSVRALTNPGGFYSNTRSLCNMIRKNGATPVLYSTWGRKAGHSTLEEKGWTNESMTWMLAAAYSAIGREMDVPVAFVGLSFFDVYTGESGIDIYNEDKTHPNNNGSYLAAATLFAKIFNIRVENNEFIDELTAADALALRRAADRAVFDTPQIPAKYETNSEGVNCDDE